jgi:epoxyqueuosine reductase QueG
MRNKILELAAEQKISAVGICKTSDYIKRTERLFEKASFCAEDKGLPDDAKSIIVCAFSYYNGERKGNISRYAQGADYHFVAREKMNPICEYLKENGFSAESFADTGALNERVLANLSGIAFLGKNQMAINKELGSYFFIGYIVTDCELEADLPETSNCADCGNCIKACPLGALSESGFCEEKCLSYLTQKKGELSFEEKEAIKKTKTIWGCDICQEVCPHNKGIAITSIPEFRENLIIDLEIDESLSNKEFKRLYGNRAFSWRGKQVIERNLKIVNDNI